MAITTEAIRELREQDRRRRHGLPAGARGGRRRRDDRRCKILQQQGLERMAKKAGRVARQGLVESYIHAGGRIGALVELNCETDFVARDDDFRALAHDIAMQIAATAPEYVAPRTPRAELADDERKSKVLLLPAVHPERAPDRSRI